MADAASTRTVLFSAFEPSGDDRAAPIIAELVNRDPDRKIIAVGGQRMREAGAELIVDSTREAVMGLRAVAKFRELRRLIAGVIARHDADPFALHVPVDSPAANFPLCKALRKRGVSGVHLVAPQVWAWAPWRLRKLRRVTNHVLCVLPFEEAWFRSRGVPATFIGHSALNRTIDEAALAEEARSLPEGAVKLAIFPGSREHEVKNNLPMFLDVVRTVRAEHREVVTVIAAGDGAATRAVNVQRSDDDPRVVRANAASVVHWCDVALTVSGTMTLDIVRQRKPMVGVYCVNTSSMLLSRMLLVTPHRLLPNIIAGRAIVPEFVPHSGGPGPIVEALKALLFDASARQAQQRELDAILEMYEGKRPAIEAADVIERVIRARGGC